MNYYLDTEFTEGTQKKKFLGITYGETKPTIDLISIGIVSEDNREYYAISKDFNLREAWNRWQTRTGCGDYNNINPKEYWIRENVLKPIFEEWKAEGNEKIARLGLPISSNKMPFTYKNFKYCIKCIGKSNKQIAEEVKEFCSSSRFLDLPIHGSVYRPNPIFYAYFADYDWVVFCQLFGSMIDLPNGFPKYCRDLKQILDEKGNPDHRKYIAQENEHNALDDAKWNKKLYEFINKL